MRTVTRFARPLIVSSGLLLSLLSASAYGNRFEISNTGIRASFAALRFYGESILGSLEISCPVVIEGTFHSRTIIKLPEELVGYITTVRITAERCEGSGAVEAFTVLSRFPWHIRYEGFVGALPSVSRINLRFVLLAYSITAFFGTLHCLYSSTAASPLRFWFERNTTTGQVSNIVMDRTSSIPLFEGHEPECPPTNHAEGVGTVRLLGTTTTLIFIRLI
jgi:hypothetical protein